MAYLLSNKEVTEDAGHTFGATRFICDRLGVGNLATLITNQLSARPLIVQMLAYARGSSRIGQESSISYIILSWLERSWDGHRCLGSPSSSNLLEKNNQYEQLLLRSWPRRRRATAILRQWTEIRNDAALAYAVPGSGAPQVPCRGHIRRSNWRWIPFGWPSRRNIEPEEVVRRLVSEAKAIHPQKGRLLVCLDEVRLYLGDNMDRITELQALAEKVKSVGLGKVFLLVTGQEAPGRCRQPVPPARRGYRDPRGSLP